MFVFILKRLLWGIPVLFAVATLTFILMHIVPGGPFDQEKVLPPEIKANVEAKYHLDKPIWMQYALYIFGLMKGDLGPSYKYPNRTINDILKDTFPVSVQLGLLALLTSVFIGVPIGLISALRQNRFFDRSSMFILITGISLPNFVLGALLIIPFAHVYRILPPALWEGWRYMVLPVITLSAAPSAYIARIMRSSALDIMEKEYIRTAKAKGLGSGSIICKHVLKNSIMPIITVLGPLTATLITGSFVVEHIFSIPGMGRFFVTAVTNRDYPLIMGVTIVYSVLIIIVNLVVDVLYGYIDPRIRVES